MEECHDMQNEISEVLIVPYTPSPALSVYPVQNQIESNLQIEINDDVCPKSNYPKYVINIKSSARNQIRTK